MAHYAFLNAANIVTEVIVGRDEDDLVDGVTDWEDYYSSVRNQRCLRTSYNTRGGVHIHGGQPFRMNFAGQGFTYDEHRDAFIPPMPYKSWVFNEETCLWDPPVAYPNDGNFYEWDEVNKEWVEVPSE